jgi:AraC family transcriptional regulator
MKTLRVEQNYRQRVERIIAFLVAHPLVEHRLEDLAAMAHFSPYHFHRIYHSVAGETVNATVRRIRLARATRLLEQGSHSITQVAMEVGYESPQAFTRAFGQFAGQSPSGFQAQLHRVGYDTDAMPQVEIIERAAQRLVALRHQGPVSTISHTHRRLHKMSFAPMVSAWLGACYGDPDEESDFRYYAAAALTSELTLDEPPLECIDIPAGRYARHCLQGPYTNISATVSAIFKRWLPASDYEADDRPVLEHYLNSPRNTAPNALRTNLLIPIRSAYRE